MILSELSYCAGCIIGLLHFTRLGEAQGRAFEQTSNEQKPNQVLDISVLMRRSFSEQDPISTEKLIKELKRQGHNEENMYQLGMAIEYDGIGLDRKLEQISNMKYQNQILDPNTLIHLYRIYPEKLSIVSLYEEMKKHGYSRDQTDNLLAATEYFPHPDDLIRFAVREVYTPEIVKEYGLSQEFPEQFAKEFARLGGRRETAEQYWRAHWVLPSPSEGYEMLHRFDKDILDKKLNRNMITPEEYNDLLFTKENLATLLKTLDVMPYWRTRLRELSYLPLTRIDVRRAYEMGVVDEEEVYINNRELGYNDKNARALTMFTIIERDMPPYEEMYQRGEIRIEHVEEELIKRGIPENIRKKYLDRLVKTMKPKRLEKERDLTKSEILKGLKAKVISEADTKSLLMGLGYDEAEAEFLIELQKITAKGDPETSVEMRRVVEFFKIAQGKKGVVISEEAIEIEKEIMALEKEKEKLMSEGKATEANEIIKRILEKQERLRILLTGVET